MRQKAELTELLDRAVALKLNTIILQVRPACDALYASKLEPWSEYLTGVMGRAPEPWYDPLAFAIQEAHRRGLELHAWFNPFRARHRQARSSISANHISKTHPEWVRTYGRYLWLDPGDPAVRQYSLSVILDVLKRYDVDGIHLDDYFYPYKEKDSAGRDMPFPDEATWKRHVATGKLSREDWRRDNVNSFIKQLYTEIKRIKPNVKFGISPFGIWRPGYPASVKGLDAYNELYADSRLWLANGWCDYFVPQLYWPIASAEQSFPALLNWWIAENKQRRHLLAGLDSTRNPASSIATEIVNQVKLTRKQDGASGHVLWSASSLAKNEPLAAGLRSHAYQEPALVPPAAWIGGATPVIPVLTARAGKTARLSWSNKAEAPWLWLLQTRRGTQWTSRVLPGNKRSWTSGSPLPEVVVLRAVSRNGIASAPVALELRK